jgi:hypothetical protein
MPDPIAQNELLRNLMDMYRIFSQEMTLVKMEKFKLIKQIIGRLDAAETETTRKKIRR